MEAKKILFQQVGLRKVRLTQDHTDLFPKGEWRRFVWKSILVFAGYVVSAAYSLPPYSLSRIGKSNDIEIAAPRSSLLIGSKKCKNPLKLIMRVASIHS